MSASELSTAGVRMGREVRLAAAFVRDVRVELGRGEIGMPEHLLDAAEVGAALEQMRRERVAEEMRVHAPGLEPGPLGEPPEDEKRARARQRPALCVEEQRGRPAPVEVRAPA